MPLYTMPHAKNFETGTDAVSIDRIEQDITITLDVGTDATVTLDIWEANGVLEALKDAILDAERYAYNEAYDPS